MAQPFDLDRLELTGDAFPVAEGVAGGVRTPFSVSADGSLTVTRISASSRGSTISREASETMIDILKAQEFNEKIPAGVPAGTVVAHKTGEITKISHDAAIVYPATGAPYVLVVLTRGIEKGDDAKRVIAAISRVVWEWRQSQFFTSKPL